MPRDQRPTNVAYYARNRQREIERVRRRQDATRDFLRELRRRPCADCGRSFEPDQMDFDHVAGKAFRLTSGRAMLMSTDRLLTEVRKCEVVCANCHRVRSSKTQTIRLGAYRSAPPSSCHDRWQRRYRMRTALLNALRDRECADCGHRFPPCAMDFDHRDGEPKVDAVTRLVGRSVDQLLAEVAKCDIVCANCHRARTYRRRAVRAGVAQ